jgi:TfuA protein
MLTEDITVFMGPSLPLAAAMALLSARFLPPVKRGDLARIESCGPVVIIDGEFGQNLSVSPKEILRLLERGTMVIGAASMGAIRAVELEPFGMRGIGWVFEAYRTGVVYADDEVALTFSPEEHMPISIPLINVRYWLAKLRESRAIEEYEQVEALAVAKSIFFADRTKSALLKALSIYFGADRLAQLLESSSGITDIKRIDAEKALRYVSHLC